MLAHHRRFAKRNQTLRLLIKIVNATLTIGNGNAAANTLQERFIERIELLKVNLFFFQQLLSFAKLVGEKSAQTGDHEETADIDNHSNHGRPR